MTVLHEFTYPVRLLPMGGHAKVSGYGARLSTPQFAIQVDGLGLRLLVKNWRTLLLEASSECCMKPFNYDELRPDEKACRGCGAPVSLPEAFFAAYRGQILTDFLESLVSQSGRDPLEAVLLAQALETRIHSLHAAVGKRGKSHPYIFEQEELIERHHLLITCYDGVALGQELEPMGHILQRARSAEKRASRRARKVTPAR